MLPSAEAALVVAVTLQQVMPGALAVPPKAMLMLDAAAAMATTTEAAALATVAPLRRQHEGVQLLPDNLARVS